MSSWLNFNGTFDAIIGIFHVESFEMSSHFLVSFEWEPYLQLPVVNISRLGTVVCQTFP